MHKKLVMMILLVFFTEISAVKLSDSEIDREIAQVVARHDLILPSKRFKNKVCKTNRKDDIFGAVLKSVKQSKEELRKNREEFENYKAQVESCVDSTVSLEELQKRLQQLIGSNTGFSGGSSSNSSKESSSSSSRGSSSNSPDSMDLSDDDDKIFLLCVASAEIQIPEIAAQTIAKRLPYYCDSPCGSGSRIIESGLGLSGSFPKSNYNDRRLKDHSVSEQHWCP